MCTLTTHASNPIPTSFLNRLINFVVRLQLCVDNKNEKDVHVGIGLLACVVLCTAIIAKRLSARQLIVHRISEIVSIYVCTCTCICHAITCILHATRKCMYVHMHQCNAWECH